jgi:hypothetical protein
MRAAAAAVRTPHITFQPGQVALAAAALVVDQRVALALLALQILAAAAVAVRAAAETVAMAVLALSFFLCQPYFTLEPQLARQQ